MHKSGKKWVIIMFIGEFHHSIDEKGRIIIPSKLRDGLNNDFIITRGLDGCLSIYPKIEWEKLINKYKELPNTIEKRHFLRIFLSGASTGEYDKQFRINIPKPLIEYGKLDKDCIFIGVDDHIELWSENIWNDFINCNEETMSNICDKLFSKE